MGRIHFERAIVVILVAATVGCARLSSLRRGLLHRDGTVPMLRPGEGPTDPIVEEGADQRSYRNRRSGLLGSVPRRSPTWQAIGQSVEGRPIEAVRLGSGPTRVLVIGTIHGDEPEGLPIVQRLTEELATDTTLSRHSTVLVVRDLNPDGTAAATRTNARNVDLNRNFPAANWEPTARRAQFNPGPRPGSEPETQLLVELLREFRPDRILVMHSTRGKPMVNYDGPARQWAVAVSRCNRYELSDTIGYPTPGSLGSYAGKDRQIPIITLELPRGVPAETAWVSNREAMCQACR